MVAAGAVAKKWLREQYGTEIRGYMSQLGEIAVPFTDWSHVPQNPFFAANADVIPELETYMDALRRDGDSVGARIEVVASKVPVGLGEPLFDRLDADIAHAMMGINAVKGVEIGAGFDSVAQRGSVHGDELTAEGFRTNNSGGVLGGISTGQDVTVSLAIKRRLPSAPRANRSTRPAMPPPSRPSAATTPASASVPRRSPRPCWRWC